MSPLSPLVRALLVHVLVVVVAWVAARVLARRLVGPGRGRRRRSLARRLALVAALGTTGVAIAVGSEPALTARLSATVPGLGTDVYPTLSALGLFLLPVPVTAFAAYRGVRVDGRSAAQPVPVRPGPGQHPPLRTDVSRFTRGYLALTGPALLVVAAAPLFPDGWWLVAAVGLVGLFLAAATPLVVPRVVPARPLTDRELARLGLDRADTIPVRVLDVGGRPNALAAGLVPGVRVVFVTEALLATLDPDQARAVVTHELGHHRRGHIALRLGAVAGVVLPWLGATAAGIPGAFEVGVVLSAPAVLGVFALMRWTERDADRYAARRVDPEALASALERLCGTSDPGHLPAAVAPHPQPETRIARARRAAGDPPADPAD